MNQEEIKICCELMQTTAFTLKNLICSEIAMNDGEVEDCQKFNKEAQNLLAASVKDTFVEFTEIFEVESSTVADYDLPNNFELMKQLNQVQCDLSMLFDMLSDNLAEEMIKPVKEKIVISINTIKEIYEAIYLN